MHILTIDGIANFDEAVEFVAAFLVLGAAGLVIYGLPIAIAASLLSAFASGMGLTHWTVPLVAGAILGAVFYLGLVGAAGVERSGSDFWPHLVSMTGAGAICGWIYWRIALRPDERRQAAQTS